ncbi:hypothetical protein LshimejAT787_0400700 [Lyophyllum shimeji]|uniref:Hydrophobin n=1 Tax=Lyophyllum shimeji TaxID=47721 RepID=A0A9P3PKA6_LYOSH|nr:hypothetical protein LshimejAT787_0400700 [Lyophyllum shimeji]
MLPKTYLLSAVLLVLSSQGASAAPNPQATGPAPVYHCGVKGAACTPRGWVCCGPILADAALNTNSHSDVDHTSAGLFANGLAIRGAN